MTGEGTQRSELALVRIFVGNRLRYFTCRRLQHGCKSFRHALEAVSDGNQVSPTPRVFRSLNTLLQNYASWKDRRSLAAAIRPIYTAASAEAAQAKLDAFAEGPLGQKSPRLAQHGVERGIA